MSHSVARAAACFAAVAMGAALLAAPASAAPKGVQVRIAPKQTPRQTPAPPATQILRVQADSVANPGVYTYSNGARRGLAVGGKALDQRPAATATIPEPKPQAAPNR